MSRENVEVVRAVIDALNREDLEAALEHMDSDFEFDASRAIGPVGGVITLGEIRAFYDEFFGLWESVRFEIDEYIEAGNRVAVSFINHHRGRDGIELTVRPSSVYTIRGGRIVHGCLYQEWHEALEAVGLTEQDAHADS